MQGQAAFARLCVPCSLTALYRGRELPAWLLALCAASLVQKEQATSETFVPCETGHQTWMERQHQGWQAEPHLGKTEVRVHGSVSTWHECPLPQHRSVVTEQDEIFLHYSANVAWLLLAGQSVGCQARLWLVAGSGKFQPKPCCGSQEE